MDSERTVWLTAFGDLYVASRIVGHGSATKIQVNQDRVTEGVRMWEQSQRWCVDDRWLWFAYDATYRELSAAVWHGLRCPWDMDLVIDGLSIRPAGDREIGQYRTIRPIVIAEAPNFNMESMREVAREALASVPLVIT